MLDKLTSADFLAFLNQPFVVILEGPETYSLELVSVREWGEAASPDSRRPFSIIFSNPRKDAYLSQRIYRLEHEKMGPLELFLVPLGPDKSGMNYEAIFS
jgi:hypothetical protein